MANGLIATGLAVMMAGIGAGSCISRREAPLVEASLSNGPVPAAVASTKTDRHASRERRGAADPHVHEPVTADDLGISEELGATPTGASCDDTKKCKGVVSTEMNAALVALARRTRHCYGVARISEGTLHGTVGVELTINDHGDVCSVVVTDGTLHSRAVDDCVEKMFREQRGIPGVSGCVRVKIPLRFESGDVKPDSP